MCPVASRSCLGWRTVYMAENRERPLGIDIGCAESRYYMHKLQYYGGPYEQGGTLLNRIILQTKNRKNKFAKAIFSSNC